MRSLLVFLTVAAGLALIGAKPRQRGPSLLPAPDEQRREPESWLAGETEAFAGRS